MKKILYLSLIVLLATTFSNCKRNASSDKLNSDLISNPMNEDGKSGDLPIFQFETETHNFENIFAGEVVSYSFKFKNVGKADLLISDAKASCGCTVPEYPKTPIKPGDSGLVKVTFNSAGKQGLINKSVTLMANTVPNTKALVITGFVVVK